jgi:putative DNA primase/helicase
MSISYAILEPLLQTKSPDVSKAAVSPEPAAPALMEDQDSPPLRGRYADPDSEPAKSEPRSESRPSGPSSIKAIPLAPDGLRTFRDVASHAVEWLWRGWIPLGKLTVISGASDVGKSTLLMDLAARVSTTGLMPDRAQGGSGNVIVMSAQDDAQDTTRPRLEAAGADLERIIDLSQILDDGSERPIEIAADLPRIEAVIGERDVRLVIIDPFPALPSSAQADKIIYQVSHIAAKHRCAICCTLNRAANGIAGHARAGLLVAEDPTDDAFRILAVAKSNLAVKPKSLRFKLDPVGAVCLVSWQGTSDYVANQLVGPAPTQEEKEAKAEAMNKVQGAIAFLRDLLKYCPMRVRDCKRMAAEAGFATRTVERAARELGLIVTAKPDYEGGRRFMWALKDGEMARCTISLAELGT